MNGGNLHDIISCKTEALPWAERVQMSMDVAKAMSYLHSEGLFHRDLTSRVCWEQELTVVLIYMVL